MTHKITSRKVVKVNKTKTNKDVLNQIMNNKWEKNTGCIKKFETFTISQPIRRSNKRSKLHSKRSAKYKI